MLPRQTINDIALEKSNISRELLDSLKSSLNKASTTLTDKRSYLTEQYDSTSKWSRGDYDVMPSSVVKVGRKLLDTDYFRCVVYYIRSSTGYLKIQDPKLSGAIKFLPLVKVSMELTDRKLGDVDYLSRHMSIGIRNCLCVPRTVENFLFRLKSPVVPNGNIVVLAFYPTY